MGDPSLGWKIVVWRINAVLAAWCAVAEALTGDWVCFLWAGLVFLDWKIADYLSDKQKGQQDDEQL